MTLETLTDKLFSDPKVKKHYDELAPKFEKAKKKILKNRCKDLVENIAKDNPDSLSELYELLINFKVRKNK